MVSASFKGYRGTFPTYLPIILYVDEHSRVARYELAASTLRVHYEPGGNSQYTHVVLATRD